MAVFPTCKPQLFKNFDHTYSAICPYCVESPRESFKLCSKKLQMKFCNFKTFLIVEEDRIIGEVLKCMKCDIIVPDKILMVCDPLDEKENCSCKTVAPDFDEFLCLDHINTSILYEEIPCNFEKEGNYYTCTKCPAFVTPQTFYKLKKSGTSLTCRSSPHASNYYEYFQRKIAIHQNQVDAFYKLVFLLKIISLFLIFLFKIMISIVRLCES